MKRNRALMALSLLIMAPVITHADTLSDIKSRGVLTVGIKNDYPPYGFMNAEGKTVGFEVDLARSIAANLLGSPDKIKLVPVNASNRIQFLQSGQIDLIMATLGVTPERAKEIDFTVEYVSAAGPSVMARKEAKFNQWEQLKGQKICGIQGSYYNKTLTQKYGIQLVNFTALPEAIVRCRITAAWRWSSIHNLAEQAGRAGLERLQNCHQALRVPADGGRTPQG